MQTGHIHSRQGCAEASAFPAAFPDRKDADEPEFSSANGMGSDCANFVSKCINAGDNWMRTGYYDNGGVKTYMTNKGYFQKTTKAKAKKGGFMFWNNTSHVALVVSNDGTTVKYSQHSSVKQSQVTKTYTSALDVSFYNCTK